MSLNAQKNDCHEWRKTRFGCKRKEWTSEWRKVTSVTSYNFGNCLGNFTYEQRPSFSRKPSVFSSCRHSHKSCCPSCQFLCHNKRFQSNNETISYECLEFTNSSFLYIFSCLNFQILLNKMGSVTSHIFVTSVPWPWVSYKHFQLESVCMRQDIIRAESI
jgi:hypothetical protein